MELIKLQTNPNDPFIGYAESRVGGRSENQDSFSFSDTPIGFLVTVCDGMGGGPAGKKASSIAVTEIIKGVIENSDSEKSHVEIVKDALTRANISIIKTADGHPELKGMGTTATVLLINEESAIIAHVGDSRVYQLRGRKKIFRTFDHSMVFDMVRQGIITEEQARLSTQSNIITRALGIKEDVDIDVCEVPYERNDKFMLCTDGIHGCMSEKDLLKLAAKSSKSIGPIVDNIATTADDIGRINGGEHDNLTVAIVQTKKDSILKSKMSRRTKKIILLLVALCLTSILLNIIQCVSSNNTETIDINKVSHESEINDTLSKIDLYNKNDSTVGFKTAVKSTQSKVMRNKK